ncbi:MAG: helix-turn-helix transcriptional regulator [Oscillospiraceae bacterium]|nr:helix-turn-helix transcriptional regulator [Oscillospiraceae bacterium]
MTYDTFLVKMGLRIAEQRKTMHLTQEQLADKMGVSLQTVSCIELGKKAVRPENLANLCTSLDVTSDYILYGKRNKQQMDDTMAKLSSLDCEAYRTVQGLINLLYERQSR